MAREEQDREDLMREATALVERVELRTASETESVIVGFRRNGCASVYFGGDPAYHFNSRNELRRAYVAGRLWKADQGRLIAMRHARTEMQVELHSQPLRTPDRQVALQELQARLEQLAADLGALERHTVACSQPPDVDALSRVRQWLESLRHPITVAARPHVI